MSFFFGRKKKDLKKEREEREKKFKEKKRQKELEHQKRKEASGRFFPLSPSAAFSISCQRRDGSFIGVFHLYL